MNKTKQALTRKERWREAVRLLAIAVDNTSVSGVKLKEAEKWHKEYLKQEAEALSIMKKLDGREGDGR